MKQNRDFKKISTLMIDKDINTYLTMLASQVSLPDMR